MATGIAGELLVTSSDGRVQFFQTSIGFELHLREGAKIVGLEKHPTLFSAYLRLEKSATYGPNYAGLLIDAKLPVA